MKTKSTFYFIALLMIGLITINSCKDDDCAEQTWFQDLDGDGFGDLNVTESACDQPAGFVENSTDIDDSNANVNPNTVWSGESMVFAKENNADWTLAANQDQLTSNVSLTRGNTRGLFNIVIDTEGGQDGGGPQPSDTEWAIGSISDGIGALNFTTWGGVHGGFPNTLVDQNMVVHLITDNIYIDIRMTQWSAGGTGGGFSYIRSTNN